MRTWIRFAVAPALSALLWTTLPEQVAAQGRGRGAGRVGGGGGAVVSGNRAFVNPGGYYGGNRYYGGGRYGYNNNNNGLGYGLAGFAIGYGLGSGLGGYGPGGYGLGYGSGYYGGNAYYGNSYYSNAAPVQSYQSFYPPTDTAAAPPTAIMAVAVSKSACRRMPRSSGTARRARLPAPPGFIRHSL